MSRPAAAQAHCHSSVEELSAYLDRELAPARLRLVETHLEDCEECRRRVEGLGRLVRDLRRLERFEPPPALGQQLLGRLHRSSRPRTVLERLEEGLKDRNLQSPLGFSFALVVAFAALLYFFSGSLDRLQRNQTSILRPTNPSQAATAVVPGKAPRKVGDRSFRWDGGAWRQEGLATGVVPEEVDAKSPLGQQVLGVNPELAQLLAEGEVVVFEIRGVFETEGVFEMERRVLLLRPSPPGQIPASPGQE